MLSSSLPGSPFGPDGCTTKDAILPYLALLRAGFTVPPSVTTDAVRSYRTLSPLPAPKCLGGLLSVALAVGSRLPGVTWRSGRRSPDFPRHRIHGGAIAWPTLSVRIVREKPAIPYGAVGMGSDLKTAS